MKKMNEVALLQLCKQLVKELSQEHVSTYSPETDQEVLAEYVAQAKVIFGKD